MYLYNSSVSSKNDLRRSFKMMDLDQKWIYMRMSKKQKKYIHIKNCNYLRKDLKFQPYNSKL